MIGPSTRGLPAEGNRMPHYRAKRTPKVPIMRVLFLDLSVMPTGRIETTLIHYHPCYKGLIHLPEVANPRHSC
jgi:hypothetical protein